MKKIHLLFLIFILNIGYNYAQGSCATATNLGTPTTTQSCQTITSATGTTGGTSCTGGGWGGNSWHVRYVTFCTNASNSCVNLDFTSTGGWSGNINFTLYEGSASCGSVVPVGAVQQCQTGLTAGGTISFAPTNNSGVVVTTANTCYTLRMAFETAPTAANPIQICAYTQAPAANDVCSGAMPIDAVPQATHNDPACSYSGGPTTNSPTLTPGSFCAGSLENTAWYTFTVLANGSVVITIDGISCVGGGSGFQIGYFTGSCGSLTNIGCNSGSGSTVTTTITGLTAGQEFPVSNNTSLSGGGVTSSLNSPYAVTGTENVIYADCGPTGFYMKVSETSGSTGSNISSGFTVTIVNTKGATGYIYTGVTGSSSYYTGFNTAAAYGNFPSSGILVSANSQYQSSITLRWEPRIASAQATQKGSWVVLGSTNMSL